MQELNLKEDEKLEDLQCQGLKIVQNKKLYTFTSDSVILANFIKLHARDNAVEIGTGCGVISILQSAKNKFNKIYAFELQHEMAELAKKNVRLNNLEDKIEIICDDIKNFNKYIQANQDCVFSNPPYMTTSNQNENEVRDISRHDSRLKIEELCQVAAKMLKDGGRFYVIYGANRSSYLIYNLIKNNLAPKRMFFTQNGKGDVKRVVIEAVKGGKNEVKVLPELITNDINGEYLEKLHTKYLKS